MRCHSDYSLDSTWQVHFASRPYYFDLFQVFCLSEWVRQLRKSYRPIRLNGREGGIGASDVALQSMIYINSRDDRNMCFCPAERKWKSRVQRLMLTLDDDGVSSL